MFVVWVYETGPMNQSLGRGLWHLHLKPDSEAGSGKVLAPGLYRQIHSDPAAEPIQFQKHHGTPDLPIN